MNRMNQDSCEALFCGNINISHDEIIGTVSDTQLSRLSLIGPDYVKSLGHKSFAIP